ncbi:hypothetical protein [Kyrpidia spormannii]|uniref:Uncharacterized protein n=2 Tax=Kyrpidia spormannii TaxID=2055160 RepID=A0ACA8ZD50_9BACL|nr:hypothetical protein [Kyrpidia spormannii]CAB3395071.1 protein of unknown function [Kyrpidia spormannii]CAB3395970.1 protein of unknown function [Kyrpidia spormannii]
MGTQSIEVLRSISEVPIPETLLQGSDFSQVPEKIKKALEALESAEKTAKSYTEMPWYKQIINVVSGEALFDTMTIEKTLLESQKLLTWLMVISIMLTKEIRDHQIQIHDLHDQIYDDLVETVTNLEELGSAFHELSEKTTELHKTVQPDLVNHILQRIQQAENRYLELDASQKVLRNSLHELKSDLNDQLSGIQAAVAVGAKEFKSYRRSIVRAIAIAIGVTNLAWIVAFLWLHAVK